MASSLVKLIPLHLSLSLPLWLAACSSSAPHPKPVALDSKALFAEAAKTFLHPRCANCHPSDDTPRQGDRGVLHDPPVTRGEHDRGVPAMQCTTCHQDANLELSRVPGAPGWHLAPAKMAWLGKSPSELCAQLKSGEMSLDKLVEHVRHDKLVAWGWSPGHGRTPAPGSAAQLGDLLQSWIDTGAQCP